MSDDPFPGSSADFYERIQVLKNTIEEQQAEITRLETINSSRTFLYLEARSLITELCACLECHNLDHLQDDLISRAHEATR